ncbi:type 5 acid phosphatase [Salpingoeca rosetta]|uniref:acid phosphatase n=1 Tax=Salpingoeca rosetta (strain ATCC 50818 / BSB-021) TaxID=946362 RepID=F2UIS7_SALR5|nr:type 5 acid phosphatase [Salpingoeca rosetta]EGD77126.1 type 5 acid phosphatase [Salpingoeca rosetta]|eukprot:XP_004990965.1 type 5 acid phosphatase [Salpingoeca rosetta]
MAKVAKDINAQFVLALGDNFYTTGIQGDEHNFRFRATFEDVYTDDSLQIPFYVVAGNHDHLGNITAQIEYSKISSRWTMPDTHYKRTFSFNSGKGGNTTLDLIMIDTVLLAGNSDLLPDKFGELPGPADPELAETQWQFIEQSIKESTADYLWVGGHYPVWSGCSHGPTAVLVLRLKPLLEQYNATGYVCGHDHCLEHIDEGKGPVYVLTGAGDNCCYKNSNVHKCPDDSIKFSVWNDGSGNPMLGGFGSFHVTPEFMTVTYHAANGTALYTTPQMKPRK